MPRLTEMMKRNSLLQQNSREWEKSRKKKVEGGTTWLSPTTAAFLRDKSPVTSEEKTKAARSGTENGNKWAFKV